MVSIGRQRTGRRLPTKVRLAATGCVVALLFLLSTGAGAAQETQDGWVKVIVELTQPAASDIWLDEIANTATAGDGSVFAADMQAIAAATAAQIALVAAEQDALAATLDDLGAQEIYRVQRIYNAIAVQIPANALAELADLPQVAAIHPLISKVPDNARGVPLIGAPHLWGAPNGLLGDGVSIGVIDTGADYLHVGLGGPGVGYQENDTAVIGDVPGFPNWRIVGGFDFAGDSYNSNPSVQPYDPVPNPDPDPMDCYDHGTHVAATVGGNGVTSAGAAYTGPYTSAVDFPEMRIGPGVAPHAQIYALKVFGCFGSSDIVDLAIEWALDPNGDGDFSDHLDVINLSLGSPVGNARDMTAVAAERAAQVGVIVVASIGNSGDTFFTTGSPGAATRAVTVAATRVEADDSNDTIASFSARGPRTGDNLLKPDLAAPGVQIVSALNGSGNRAAALNGTSMATPFVAGSLALLRQLYPTWSVEELKALVMNTATVVRSDSGSSELYGQHVAPPTRAGAGRIMLQDAVRSNVIVYGSDLPGSVGVSFGSPEIQGSGSALRNVRILNKGASPANYYVEYIPVVDLPGVEVQLPLSATVTISASSSATIPVILHADASAMKNVSDPSLSLQQAGLPRHWRSEEQGHLYLWENTGLFTATLSHLDAYPPNSSGASGAASFHYTPATRVLSYTLESTSIAPGDVLTITINRGLSGQTPPDGGILLFARGGDPAITLPYTGSVTLDADDARLLASNYLQLTVATGPFPAGAIAGAIVAETPVLKLPLHAAPRAVADVRAITTTLAMSTSLTANRTVTLTGTPLLGTDFPTDTQSIVAAFELHATSPRATLSGASVPDYADIKFVGVSSDWAKVANKNDARLYFALTTWGEWSTLLQTQFVVRIDTDNDLVTDYRLYSTDAGNLSNSRSIGDVFYSVLETMENGSRHLADPINLYTPDERLTALYQNDLLVLSVPIRLLGLDAAKSSFRFAVESIVRSPVQGEVGDWVSWMRYDFQRPGIAHSNMLAGTPWRDVLPGTSLTIAFDMVNYSRLGARGVLLIHPFNAAGMRAETLAVTYEWPYNFRLPLITLRGFD